MGPSENPRSKMGTGGSTGTIPDQQPGSSLDHPNSLANDNAKRKTRNMAPNYKSSATASGSNKKRGTFRGSGGLIPKKLTPRRKELISKFLHCCVKYPGKHGEVGSKGWIEELKRKIGSENRGRNQTAPVRSNDVKRWLKNPQFAKLLMGLMERSESSDDDDTSGTPIPKPKGPLSKPSTSSNSFTSRGIFVPVTSNLQQDPGSSSAFSSEGLVDGDPATSENIRPASNSETESISGNLNQPVVAPPSSFVVCVRRNLPRPTPIRPAQVEAALAATRQKEPVASNQGMEESRNAEILNSQTCNVGGMAVPLPNQPLPMCMGPPGDRLELVEALQRMYESVNSVRLAYHNLVQLGCRIRAPAAMAVVGHAVDSLLTMCVNFLNPQDPRFHW